MVKKKKSKYVSTLPPFEYRPPTVFEMGHRPSEYIKLRICNLSLTHLNFEWPAVPTEVTIGVIKDAIRKRHGGTALNLTLYKNNVSIESMLRDIDDGVKLKDLGVRGIVSGPAEDLPVVSIHYDFSAARPDDPIIAVETEAEQSKHNLNVKQYLRMQRAMGYT
mmetsp:Transcript_14509/g.31557  ORF Transcript_14509/g.31557 Transcript_14509/m.31557 type:complete len:163 (-) Transcript_14509:927-1415(-)